MNIKCTQNIYKSANGSTDIAYYILQPEGVDLRGIIQISHGVCEYFSRYTTFAKYLCGLGFVVCGNDHLGHGASAQSTADLGFFSARDGWRYLVHDMGKLTDIMRLRYPDLPCFVIGHSMGSLLTRLYLPQYGTMLNGAILCGTVGPAPFAYMAARVANSIAHSKGATYRSAFLSQIAYRHCNRKLREHAGPFDWLNRDPQAVDLFQCDEKCNFLLTATGYRDLFLLVGHANDSRNFRQTPRNLAILLLAGDADPISGHGEGVRQVANLYRGAGLQDIDLILYKGARHEILNETNRHEVFGDISRWLEQHLANSHAASEVNHQAEHTEGEEHVDCDNREHTRQAL